MNARAAFLLAVDAHAGVDDKVGEPYIFHPIAVAEAVKGLGEDFEVVAFLHDVFEDTPARQEDFALTERQAAALRAITKNIGETYWHYVERCRRNFIARVVKVADVQHNLSPERHAGLPPGEAKSMEKRYRSALAVLEADQ